MSFRKLFIDFCSKLCRQIEGIKCAPLVADIFFFCFIDRDFILCLSDNNQPGVVEAFNSTSRYLDDLFNIDNSYFEQMVSRMCPTEVHLNKTNQNTEAPFLDFDLSTTNGIVLSKIYE